MYLFLIVYHSEYVHSLYHKHALQTLFDVLCRIKAMFYWTWSFIHLPIETQYHLLSLIMPLKESSSCSHLDYLVPVLMTIDVIPHINWRNRAKYDITVKPHSSKPHRALYRCISWFWNHFATDTLIIPFLKKNSLYTKIPDNWGPDNQRLTVSVFLINLPAVKNYSQNDKKQHSTFQSKPWKSKQSSKICIVQFKYQDEI